MKITIIDPQSNIEHGRFMEIFFLIDRSTIIVPIAHKKVLSIIHSAMHNRSPTRPPPSPKMNFL
ncbi:hypothetical protein DERF_010470 [Dermatophagoides farinae]|uniref:Uncharacterized protein n=1 Tax=Dermatophagoides farinae TaxID=6954 RepID=A0A922L3K4_DERFA|nr:hypothetical protein DERF_010470 [Dermatophagoides farinae]